MTIKEAKEELEAIKNNKTNDVQVKNRIDTIINDLPELFGDTDDVDEKIVEKITYAESAHCIIDYEWAMDLNGLFLQMKHYQECKDFLRANGNKIDGETAQWWTTVAQGIIGVFSAVFTVLFALGIIPNIFGELGESANTDALYYVIGTICQQAVALIFAIIIKVINYCARKKRYQNKDFSYEELLAAKYKDDSKILSRIIPPFIYIDKSVHQGDNSKNQKAHCIINK